MNNLPDDLKDFVHSMIDEYIKDQTKRFPKGMEKYGTHILNDYTIEEHLANLTEELRDADAYLKAIKIKVGQLRAENEELKNTIAKMNQKIDQTKKQVGEMKWTK